MDGLSRGVLYTVNQFGMSADDYLGDNREDSHSALHDADRSSERYGTLAKEAGFPAESDMDKQLLMCLKLKLKGSGP